ncbi:MAG: hypothetical protein V1696_02660 [Candidatus Jorgensenbacteria bacterium]
MNAVLGMLKKLWRLFEWLSSKPKVGGLEISSLGVAFVHFNGGLNTYSLRLPPGTVREGKVEDPEKLLEVLTELHKAADVGGRGGLIRTVTVLPAAAVYTQNFEIPNVGEEKLGESANLNLQMISPLPKEAAYMSFERLSETPDRYELLGAFAERSLVDQYQDILARSMFSPIALEFPGLSLARLFRSVGGIQPRASLLFHVSSDGLNLLIIRSGRLYFNYFRSWKSIQGDAREISRERFEEVVAQEVQKVVNFTLGSFKETPVQLILIAPGLESDLQTFLESHFSIPVAPLEVPGWAVGPQWFVALGAAFRGAMERGKDRELSVSSAGASELFYEEQLTDFVRLWRAVVAGVMGVLLIFFGGAAYFLSGQARTALEQLEQFRTKSDTSEFKELQTKAEEFNALVKSVAGVRASVRPWSAFFAKLTKLADDNKAKIDKVEVSAGPDRPITLVARAPSYDAVIAFKNALGSDPGLQNVNLLVPQISVLEDGSVGFTVTFVAKFSP